MSQYPDVALNGIDPAHHYTFFGEAEGRDASATFSATIYAERHPETVGTGLLLLHAEQQGQSDDGRPIAAPMDPAGVADIDTIIKRRFPELRPLPVFAAPHQALRLSVVTDDIHADSIRRGVGTAIVLTALTADRIGAALRIITRTKLPDAGDVAALLDDQGIDWAGNMDFVHAPLHGTLSGVPVGSGDFFIVTSWQTAWATKLSVPRSRIAYLVLDDERLRYPFGDDHLRCSEMLRDPDMLYIAASEGLLQSLQSDGAAPGGATLGSFLPESVEHSSVPSARRRFFLCASPLVPGNLYWRGLEALSEAIGSGVLDPQRWDFYLTDAVDDLTLPGGARPVLLDRLAWADYAAEIRTMDLSLSFSDASALPDILAGDGVVVIGDLGPDSQIYTRVIRSKPDLPSLVAALRAGVRLTVERPRQETTVTRDAFRQAWNHSTSATIDRLTDWARH